MRRLLTLWRCQLQEYIWWHVATAFLVLVFVSCGLSQAFGLEELEAVFGEFCFWVALRGLLRELWCFALLLLCMVHFLGTPVALCVLCVRAYAIGFAWGWWLCSLGFAGFLTFLFLLLPQGIVVLVSLSGACCVGLAHACKHRPLDRRSYVIAIGCWTIPALCALPLEWLALLLVL